MRKISITTDQNDFDKRGPLSMFIRETIKDLNEGRDKDAYDVIKSMVFHDEKTEEKMRQYAQNSVVFVRIKVADDDRNCHYEDIVLNAVKDNVMTTTLSAQAYREARERDRDNDDDYSPMILYIPKDKLTPEQMVLILS